LVSEVYHNLKF